MTEDILKYKMEDGLKIILKDGKGSYLSSSAEYYDPVYKYYKRNSLLVIEGQGLYKYTHELSDVEAIIEYKLITTMISETGKEFRYFRAFKDKKHIDSNDDNEICFNEIEAKIKEIKEEYEEMSSYAKQVTNT
jgi:hypothetical protein